MAMLPSRVSNIFKVAPNRHRCGSQAQAERAAWAIDGPIPTARAIAYKALAAVARTRLALPPSPFPCTMRRSFMAVLCTAPFIVYGQTTITGDSAVAADQAFDYVRAKVLL